MHYYINEMCENAPNFIATFHATCTAFQQEDDNLDEVLSFLSKDHAGSIWFHSDMQAYLQEMYETCLQFLKVKPRDFLFP